MWRGRLIGRLALLAGALVLWAFGGQFAGVGAVLAVVAVIVTLAALNAAGSSQKRETLLPASPADPAATDQSLPEIAPALRALRSMNTPYDQKRVAIYLLARSGHPDGVSAVGKELLKGVPEFKMHAARALSELASPDSLPYLEQALMQPLSRGDRLPGAKFTVVQSKEYVIATLAKIGTPRAVEALNRFWREYAGDADLEQAAKKAARAAKGLASGQ
jgi:hypothetical protein